MKKVLIISLTIIFSVFFLSVQGKAKEIPMFGGNLDLNLIINATSMTLKDSADSIYLGTLDGKWQPGVGAEASLFYPLSTGIKAGPHFIFNYCTANSTWHTFSLFQTSLGGIVDFNISDNSSVSAFADYNLGWFNAEQTISSVAGYPAPAGDFAGGFPGLIIGIKSHTKVSDSIGVGLYYDLGILALTGIKYKFSATSTQWMNAEINFSQAGVIVYF